MITIHGVPFSVHTRKVIVAAHEKQLPIRIEPVIPFQPPPDWSSLSPTGKIPVLTDGDWVLPDSSAICAYFERLVPDAPLYPSQHTAYARALFLEEYADGTLFPELIRPLFHEMVIRPKVLGLSCEAPTIDRLLREVMPRLFGFLERETGRGTLAGDTFSIADIALVSNLVNFHYLGLRIDADYPQLQRYFREHLTRPSLQRTLREEQPPARSMGLAVEAIAA